jgi:hypothetical protein
MTDLAISLALILAGVTLGWTAFFSFIVSPQAFRELDHGRANRFVRNAMKTGHPVVAGLSFAAGVFAILNGALAGGGVMAITGVMYLLAAWTLAPRDDDRPPPGGKRKLSTARVVAAGLTAGLMALVVIAIVLMLFGV